MQNRFLHRTSNLFRNETGKENLDSREGSNLFDRDFLSCDRSTGRLMPDLKGVNSGKQEKFGRCVKIMT